MDYLEKKFEIDLARISNFMETSLDMSTIYFIEMAGYENGYYIEEANTNVIEKIKSGFQKLIKMITDFCKKMYNAAVVKITQKKVQFRLRKLKKELSQSKSTLKTISTGKEVSYKEIKSYVKDYEKFINDYVKLMKDFYRFDFKTAEEVEEKFIEIDRLINEKYSKMLNCTEMLILCSGVMEQLEMTDKEVANLNKCIANIIKTNNTAIDDLSTMSEDIWEKISRKIFKEAEENVTIEIDTNKIETKKVKVFQKAGQEIAGVTKKVVKVVCNHPVEILLLVSNKYANHYNDEEYRKKKEKFDNGVKEFEMKRDEEKNMIKDKYIEGDE